MRARTVLQWTWLLVIASIAGCGRDGAPDDRTYRLSWIHGERMAHFSGEGSVIGMRESMFNFRHPALHTLSIVYNNAKQWDGSQSTEATHGTHMLGILAANGSARGLAPEADYALTSTRNHIMAFEELEEAGVDVISNAFIMATYAGYKSILKTVKDQTLHARGGTGIVHVFAAGNQGKRIEAGVTFPKEFGEYALIVGELDEGHLALCSNHGEEVDVFIPMPVLTTTVGGGYAIDRGSSSATAVATAVIARARQLREDLNATTLMDLICKSADHIGSAPYDRSDTHGNLRSKLYGCGRLNAEKFFHAVETF